MTIFTDSLQGDAQKSPCQILQLTCFSLSLSVLGVSFVTSVTVLVLSLFIPFFYSAQKICAGKCATSEQELKL